MAVVVKYANSIVWGATGAGSSSLGIILSCTRKKTSEIYEQKNAAGENHSVVFFDPKEELTVEILAAADATLPEPGDEVTIGGVTSALVIDAEKRWSNTDAQKVTMTLKKWLA